MLALLKKTVFTLQNEHKASSEFRNAPVDWSLNAQGYMSNGGKAWRGAGEIMDRKELRELLGWFINLILVNDHYQD